MNRRGFLGITISLPLGSIFINTSGRDTVLAKPTGEEFFYKGKHFKFNQFYGPHGKRIEVEVIERSKDEKKIKTIWAVHKDLPNIHTESDIKDARKLLLNLAIKRS